MFLKTIEINKKSLVADIVAKDYRTADVFRRYGIGYCCGGKWPIDIACEMQGVDADTLRAELETVVRNIQISSQINFADWDTRFLIDYIINVHHSYLKKTLPGMQVMLEEFAIEHVKKYPFLEELEQQFKGLQKKLLQALEEEEKETFPYIQQLINAYKNKDSYGALYLRTLRKPVEDAMFKGHVVISDIITSIRHLTNQYNTPENVCTSHKVVLARLKELDMDIMQHLFLEKSILFPRAIAMEKEILGG